MKKIFASLILTFLMTCSFGQSETFLDLSNKLYCYAYDYKKADTATYNFLKANFPYLTQPTPEGGWVGAPITVDATFSTTTLKFEKHPFFQYNLKSGQLDFETVNEPGARKTEQGAKLTLVFKNENEASVAYKELVDKFMKNSTTQDTSTVQDKAIAKFTGLGENNRQRRAQLVLSKNSSLAIYKIEFGRYFW